MRALTREEAAVAVIAGAAAVALLIWSGMAAEGAYRVQGAVEGVPRSMAYPPGHQHLATPDEIGTVLWGPHPVYCQQNGPGTYRDALIARGWEFLADPPGEKTI